MPTRNIVKNYGAGHYYHVYNRGVNKDNIFIDESDYWMFLSLFKRHLSPVNNFDKYGREFPNHSKIVELVEFCLMPNHYHLLLFNLESEGVEKLMRSVMTSYSMYFNKRHGRVGSLFQNHFLGSLVNSDEYLWQVSRYIHLNPLDIGKDPFNYEFSSLAYYKGEKSAEWVHPESLVDSSKSADEYMRFVKENVDYHKEYKELRSYLAN